MGHNACVRFNTKNIAWIVDPFGLSTQKCFKSFFIKTFSKVHQVFFFQICRDIESTVVRIYPHKNIGSSLISRDYKICCISIDNSIINRSRRRNYINVCLIGIINAIKLEHLPRFIFIKPSYPRPRIFLVQLHISIWQPCEFVLIGFILNISLIIKPINKELFIDFLYPANESCSCLRVNSNPYTSCNEDCKHN